MLKKNIIKILKLFIRDNNNLSNSKESKHILNILNIKKNIINSKFKNECITYMLKFIEIKEEKYLTNNNFLKHILNMLKIILYNLIYKLKKLHRNNVIENKKSDLIDSILNISSYIVKNLKWICKYINSFLVNIYKNNYYNDNIKIAYIKKLLKILKLKFNIKIPFKKPTIMIVHDSLMLLFLHIITAIISVIGLLLRKN